MDLLLHLRGFAAAALREMSFESRGGDALPAPNVWIGDLPGKRERPGKEDFPFVLLEYLEGADDLDGDGPSRETVRMLVGVYAGGPLEADVSPAYQDLTNALDRLRRRALAHPRLAGRWTLAGRTKVELYDEQPWPYYFGSLTTRWEHRRPDREMTAEEEIDVYGSAYGNGTTGNWRVPGDAPDGVPDERG
jgi:hypothetical protein